MTLVWTHETYLPRARKVLDGMLRLSVNYGLTTREQESVQRDLQIVRRNVDLLELIESKGEMPISNVAGSAYHRTMTLGAMHGVTIPKEYGY